MIAVATQNFAFDKLPFGWFDVALVVILGFGVFRGRKNGMTKEILPLFQMVTMVAVATLGYAWVGQLMAGSMGLTKPWAFVLSYLSLAFVVLLVFTFVKRLYVEKLSGTNFFGSGEYYLAMVSGAIRYAVILIFALALLNAPVYNGAEIQAHKAYVDRWYGANYFPGLSDTQQSIFRNSFSGRFIRDNLSALLINTGAPTFAQTKVLPQGITTIIH